jgi:hypothetical protein
METFKHKLEIHINYTDPTSDYYITWCENNIAPNNRKEWEWKWYDGGQYGWHEFYFKDEADLLIFKIVHGV